MSNKVSTPVWDYSKAKGARRLLLAALADSANDEGHCWAKIATIAGKTRTSDRQVQQHIAELVAMGELIAVSIAGRGSVSHFWIPILEGEDGYDPQPCDEPHRCNRFHTPLESTEYARTAEWLNSGKRKKGRK